MRYKKALLILALVTCLTACEKSSTSNDMDGAHYWDADGNPITFSGIVGKGYETTLAEVSETDIADNTDTMVSEGFFLPCTNGSYLMIVDNQGPTEMFPENGDNSIYDDLSAGDTIMVTHSGIEEAYPGQTTIYSIEKISDGDLSDIPADTLTKLEEIGWIAVTNSQSVE